MNEKVIRLDLGMRSWLSLSFLTVGLLPQEKKQALAVCEAQVIWEDAGPCAVQSPSPCCVCPPPTVGASIRVADATPACRALDLVSLGGS